MTVANTATAGNLALRARGVRMEYYDRTTKERFVAIETFDLDIADGEFVTVVGPSGCGKSTFLKLVNGLLTATKGDILVKTVAKGQQDAMVFQDSALFPWYKIIDNVSYGLMCAGVSKKAAQARALPLIKLVGLGGFEQKYPYQLSGGMQQRANLARALAVDPALLLMDEPFAALDAQTREVMQAELLRIWRGSEQESGIKKTVLFITHQIEEAVYLSDRVVVMSARPGRIMADIKIDLPRPRDLHIKRTAEFQAYEEQIWELISSQLKAAGAQFGGKEA